MFKLREYKDEDMLKFSPMLYIVKMQHDYILLHIKAGDFSYEEEKRETSLERKFFEYRGTYFLMEEELKFYD